MHKKVLKKITKIICGYHALRKNWRRVQNSSGRVTASLAPKDAWVASIIYCVIRFDVIFLCLLSYRRRDWTLDIARKCRVQTADLSVKCWIQESLIMGSTAFANLACENGYQCIMTIHWRVYLCQIVLENYAARRVRIYHFWKKNRKNSAAG